VGLKEGQKVTRMEKFLTREGYRVTRERIFLTRCSTFYKETTDVI